MWLIRLVQGFCGWALSICRKIVQIAPGAIAAVVLFTLVSQLSRLLAFLLPLKIVLLIGSSGVPRYFPPFLLDYDRDNLVVWLGMATIGFFVSHIVAEKVVDRFTERTADRVLAKSDKLALFQNQDDVARTACRKFAETIALAIFVGLAVALIAFVHSSVAILLTVWGLAWVCGGAIGGAFSPRFRSWLEGNASKYVSTAASTGIFAVTALIIAEFVFGADLQILFAIISIILSRQALSRVSKVVSNALNLNSRKLLINALFLRGHLWQGNASPRQWNVWNLLATGEQQRWLPKLLEDTTGRKVQFATITAWHQTGLIDVLAVEAVAKHGDGGEESYFVKLFGHGKALSASRETDLQAACGPGRLPAPPLLGRHNVDEYACLVHGNLAAETLGGDERSELRMAAFAACWSVELPSELVARFKRTHRLLHQRLRDADLNRLALTAFEPEQQYQVERFSHCLDPLCTWLGNVPQALFNPDLNTELLFVGVNERPVVADWGRWGIEPVGAGWPTNNKNLEELPDWLRVAQEKRPGLAKVTVADARLVALLFDFEKVLRKQNMRRATAMLSMILDEVKQREGFAWDSHGPAQRIEGPARLATRRKARRLTKIAQ